MLLLLFTMKFFGSLFLNNKWYLSMYEDVRISEIRPRTHFRKYGWAEGRYPFRPLRFNSIQNGISHKEIEILLLRNEIYDLSSDIFIKSLNLKSFPRW